MAYPIAKIAVSSAVYQVDKPYDYIIPESMSGAVAPGMRVIVPFGRGNKKSEGVVLSCTVESGPADIGGAAAGKLKSIEALLDDEPVLNEENLRLAIWMADRFFCSVYDAIHAMLPAGMWFKDGQRRLGDKTVKTAALVIDSGEADTHAGQKAKTAPRQAAVLQLLSAVRSMSVNEICYFTGASAATIKALEKQGFLTVENIEAFRRPDTGARAVPEPITLNDGQREAFEGIKSLLKSGKPEAALLHGVTGSGKTIVYVKLIEEVTALGRTAIVLVPEIALTPQTVSIFASYFGDAVAVLHSALAAGERYDEWKRIRSGAVRVVVGTRSAVFAPLMNIGLIVIDEEQEHTYKSESSPRYHARDIAKYRVSRANALLLLSSATPSVGSMYNAVNGKYHLFRIENRFNEGALPPVIIADMRKELKNGCSGLISGVLRKELTSNISNNEQSILFLNRRGTNPLVVCGECGYTYRCANCSVSMTYHSARSRLVCHYCGSTLHVPGCCPDCGGKLNFLGAGTQRAESELKEIFPGINIIRMDADTVSRANPHSRLLARFKDENAQILLGTQMVTKGLDFENVTLVGVLSADASLYMSDYRAHERTFSLITQVVGRSGRGVKPGRAVIQTFTPEHEVLTLASRQDYDAFYEREMVLRRSLGGPPVRDLMAVTVTGIEENAVIRACEKLSGALAHYFAGDSAVRILGPAPPPVSKVNNKYRYRLLINCVNSRPVRDTIAHTVKEFSRGKHSKGVSVFADAEVYD